MQRNCYFDNLKVLAIYLVVLTHCLMPMKVSTNEWIRWVYNCMFFVHMPLFFYVSGVFAKFDFKKIFTKFLYPYFLFQVVMFLIMFFGNISAFDVYFPFYSLWYLLILPIFLATTIVLKKVGSVNLKIFILFLSVIIALVFGYIPIPNILGILSRAICLYPFFLFGYFFKDIKFYIIFKRFGFKILCFIIIIAVFISSFFIFKGIDMDLIFYLSYEYEPLPYRILRYIFTFLVLFSVLGLMTTKNMWFTSYGSRTKTIYLYHIFFAIASSYIYNHFDSTPLKLVCMIIVAFIMCILFGNKWFYKYTRYTTELANDDKSKIYWHKMY